jgi:hypothetical protein
MSQPNQELNSRVFLCGYATSGLALLLLYWLNQVDIDPMGYYVDFIFPAGALLTGVAAGSGYGLGSYWSNVRVSRLSMRFIFMMGVLTFLLAQYITYCRVLAEQNIPNGQLGFLGYLKILCENMAFQEVGPHREAVSLGRWGYLVMVAEGIGFSLGGIVPLAILRRKPYCDACNRYMKRQNTVTIVSEELRTSLKKLKKPERAAAIEAALKKLSETAHPILNAIPNLEYEQCIAVLNALPTVPTKGRLAYIAVTVRKCLECGNYVATAALHAIDARGRPIANKPRQIVGAVTQPICG